MRRLLPPVRRTFVVGLVVVAAAAGVPLAAAGPSTAALLDRARPAAPAAQIATAPVTLITGDRVRLVGTGERQRAELLPRPGRAPGRAIAERIEGRMHVVPVEAGPLLAAGRLDPRLFDVTGLVEAGYAGKPLPVLLTGEGGPVTLAPGARRAAARAVPPAPPAGSELDRRIAGLGVTAVGVNDADAFWAAVTTAPAARAAAGADRSLAAGLGTIWLNGRVKASLDHSVPQIGTPAARARGLDGTGISVAVLDTGIDDQQADLAGRVTAEQDFVGEGDTDDHNGHGTHVASTVAGSGANSAGKYAGVAPKASLIDGKVLDESGYGDDAGVLAGMDWAASRADVVSMSLGGGYSDGKDPMSLAVDALTAQHGALFVIAAGNDGDGGEQNTVSSPGSAASALTVGAVDRDDVLAEFSSRGPLTDGAAIKPEITAPGVDIVAAQADGTELGDVVAPHYVALSGTSMATPHVSGAAALLKQQHPGWTPAQLKAGLVSTAAPQPDTEIRAQGVGRVDLAAATADRLRVDAGTLDLGLLGYPHGGDPAVTRQLTYTNDGAAPVAVTLAGSLADAEGTAAPAAALALSATSFTLAPGASRAVTVTVTPDLLAIGNWTGLVTATTPSGPTRTAVSLVKEREKYEISFRLTDRRGQPATDGRGVLMNTKTGDFYDFWTEDGTAQLRLPPGTYTAIASAWTEQDATLVVRPDIRVTKAATVALDGSKAVPYRVTTPRAGVAPEIQSLNVSLTDENQTSGFSGTYFAIEPDSASGYFWATPTAAIRNGSLDFAAHTEFQVPRLTAAVVGGTAVPLHPQALGWWTAWAGRPVVDVVRDGPSVRGKYVLIDVPEGTTGDAAIAAAAAKGAAGTLVRYDAESTWYITQEPPIPSVALRDTEWDALSARAGTGAVRVRLTGTRYTPVTYSLFEPSAGRVPPSLTFARTEADLARVDRTFRNHGRGGRGDTVTFPDSSAGSIVSAVQLAMGSKRSDYFTTSVPWYTSFEGFVTTVEEDGFTWDMPRRVSEQPSTAYRRGVLTTETYGAQVARPAEPAGLDFGFSYRSGDTASFYVPAWTDAQGRYGYSQTGDTFAWRLSSNGREIATSEQQDLTATMPARRATYTLDLAVRSEQLGGLALGTATSTRWTFSSARPGEEGASIPLISLDGSPVLDTSNAALRGSRLTFPVTARLPGDQAAPRLASLAVETSTDGGRTWTRQTATRRGVRTFDVTVQNPSTAAKVSLRIAAAAEDGTAIRQEVIGAWSVR